MVINGTLHASLEGFFCSFFFHLFFLSFYAASVFFFFFLFYFGLPLFFFFVAFRLLGFSEWGSGWTEDTLLTFTKALPLLTSSLATHDNSLANSRRLAPGDSLTEPQSRRLNTHSRRLAHERLTHSRRLTHAEAHSRLSPRADFAVSRWHSHAHSEANLTLDWGVFCRCDSSVEVCFLFLFLFFAFFVLCFYFDFMFWSVLPFLRF